MWRKSAPQLTWYTLSRNNLTPEVEVVRNQQLGSGAGWADQLIGVVEKVAWIHDSISHGKWIDLVLSLTEHFCSQPHLKFNQNVCTSGLVTLPDLLVSGEFLKWHCSSGGLAMISDILNLNFRVLGEEKEPWGWGLKKVVNARPKRLAEKLPLHSLYTANSFPHEICVGGK